MAKKLLLFVMLATIVGTGAFAELMLGASGALYLDTANVDPDSVIAEFKSGENIWYGGFVELTGRKLGLGAMFNTGTPYTDFVDVKHNYFDAAAYLSYHLLGAHRLLDVFGELGAGALVETVDNSDNWLTGNAYWYAALGAGVNLGPIGVFGKLAWDFKLARHLTQKDEFDQEYDIPYYKAMDLDGEGYMPNLRFTLGAKLILG